MCEPCFDLRARKVNGKHNNCLILKIDIGNKKVMMTQNEIECVGDKTCNPIVVCIDFSFQRLHEERIKTV